MMNITEEQIKEVMQYADVDRQAAIQLIISFNEQQE
jgi:hypothetical protein